MRLKRARQPTNKEFLAEHPAPKVRVTSRHQEAGLVVIPACSVNPTAASGDNIDKMGKIMDSMLSLMADFRTHFANPGPPIMLVVPAPMGVGATSISQVWGDQVSSAGTQRPAGSAATAVAPGSQPENSCSQH